VGAALQLFLPAKRDQRSRKKQALANKKITTFCNELIDFTDTAAIASLMDLVITVDTSVAHLSCALGIKTWLLLPKVSDYRWMGEGRLSPWYKSATLFRQEIEDDWTCVINSVIKGIQEYGN
jgi:ADP-heptose:LPS heptosyltransferase